MVSSDMGVKFFFQGHKVESLGKNIDAPKVVHDLRRRTIFLNSIETFYADITANNENKFSSGLALALTLLEESSSRRPSA